ncbi:TPA: LamG domain-containing protein [Candidatus Poribacteria bacterium]|nr:LamG domain-containing protein [Candidatus Poribacteria bacterium]
MKPIATKLTVVYISLIIITLIDTSQSYAKIDIKTAVGIWFYDEGKGDIAKDASENGYDGKITGGKWEKGKFQSALSFDKGDTVTAVLGSGTVRNNMTVLMWINFLDLAGQQNYFSIWDSSNNRYVPYKPVENIFRFWSNNWNIPSGFAISAKTWYHVTNVYDGSKAYIYVDGELKVSQSAPNFSLADNQQTAWVATDRGTGFLSNCIVDEVGLFNVALSGDDIKNIVTKGLARATGITAVEPANKITQTWGLIKSEGIVKFKMKRVSKTQKTWGVLGMPFHAFLPPLGTTVPSWLNFI